MAVGDQISAARYNNLQNRINNILGAGSANYGYGQTLLSSQVGAANTAYEVTALNINNLVSDMKKARQHQSGLDETGKNYVIDSSQIDVVNNLVNINSHAFADYTPIVFTDAGGDSSAPGGLTYNTIYYVTSATTNSFKLSRTVGGAPINITTQGIGEHNIFSGFRTYVAGQDFVKDIDYINLTNKIDLIEQDRYSIGIGQGTVEGLAQGTGAISQRSSQWNGQMIHDITIDFGSANAARYWFNAGGELRARATLTNAIGALSVDWAALLSNAGTVSMNYSTTSTTGNGTGSGLGFYNLTSTFQQIYIKQGTGMYSANSYVISARCDTANNTSGSARYVYFRIVFSNALTDNVTGVVTSYIEHYRPTGPNVELPKPTYRNITTLS